MAANVLHMAVNIGNVTELEQLLLSGTPVDGRDDYGNTPLHVAAKVGNRSCIVALLHAGADINATEQRMHWTPLHVAAYNGKDACTPVLVAAGANLDAEDIDGRTPWMLASKSGKEELGRLLKYVKAVQAEREVFGYDSFAGQEPAQVEVVTLSRQVAALQQERVGLASRAAAAERERDEARAQVAGLAQQLASLRVGAGSGPGSPGGLTMPAGLPEAVGELQKEMGAVLTRLAALEDALASNDSGTPDLRSKRGGEFGGGVHRTSEDYSGMVSP